MTNLDDARLQVDDAISAALLQRKPCHIQIACNLATIPHPTFEVQQAATKRAFPDPIEPVQPSECQLVISTLTTWYTGLELPALISRH